MKKPKQLHESAEDSCRILTDLIIGEVTPEQMMLLQDYSSKRNGLRAEARAYCDARVLQSFAPTDVKGIIGDWQMQQPSKKPRIDVAIVSPKLPELQAVKVALGIGNKESRRDPAGYRYYNATFPCQGSPHELRGIVTMVGRDRNVPCANACRTLFNNFDVGLCILVGIAAGLKEAVGLGDVVAAEAILDYEGARLEVAGPRKRPEFSNLGRRIARDLQYFDPSETGWHELFAESLKDLQKSVEIPAFEDTWRPRYHTGIIVAGEKLAADDSLEQKRRDYHERVRALEMEGSGFAQACDECGIPWLIVRGISDYGDPASKDGKALDKRSRKAWQRTAALAAATCVMKFLEHEYRPEEPRF